MRSSELTASQETPVRHQTIPVPIGHVLTAETVLVAQFAQLEKKLGGAMARLNERAELCQQMTEDARHQGDGANAFEAGGTTNLLSLPCWNLVPTPLAAGTEARSLVFAFPKWGPLRDDGFTRRL